LRSGESENGCRDFCRDTPSKWRAILSNPYSAYARGECCKPLKSGNIEQSRAMLNGADVYLATEGFQVPVSPAYICMGLRSLGMTAPLLSAPSRSEATPD
jgi:hypothetical protein